VCWGAGGSRITKKSIWELAYREPPGADGLLFAPFLAAGEQGILWNPSLRGTISGLTLTHDGPNIARALLEGVCFEIRRCLEFFEEEAPLSSARLAGWMAEIPQQSQLLADILGRPVHAFRFSSASAVGAALLGGLIDTKKYFEHSKATVFRPSKHRLVFNALYTKLHKLHCSISSNQAPRKVSSWHDGQATLNATASRVWIHSVIPRARWPEHEAYDAKVMAEAVDGPDEPRTDRPADYRPNSVGLVKGIDGPWPGHIYTPWETVSTPELNNHIVFKAHEDVYNLDGALVGSASLGNWVGGRLIFPRYKMGGDLAPTDLLICDNHTELHGNLGPLVGKKNAGRFSVVAFMHSDVLDYANREGCGNGGRPTRWKRKASTNSKLVPAGLAGILSSRQLLTIWEPFSACAVGKRASLQSRD
jgi:FGGY family of carbohydrate kinases, C-terminal domain